MKFECFCTAIPFATLQLYIHDGQDSNDVKCPYRMICKTMGRQGGTNIENPFIGELGTKMFCVEKETYSRHAASRYMAQSCISKCSKF